MRFLFKNSICNGYLVYPKKNLGVFSKYFVYLKKNLSVFSKYIVYSKCSKGIRAQYIPSQTFRVLDG